MYTNHRNSQSNSSGSRPNSRSSHGYKPAHRSDSRSSRPGYKSASRFSGSRFSGPRGGGHRTKNRGSQGERIEHARFINKAVITEEVEHFIPEHKFTDFQIDENGINLFSEKLKDDIA